MGYVKNVVAFANIVAAVIIQEKFIGLMDSVKNVVVLAIKDNKKLNFFFFFENFNFFVLSFYIFVVVFLYFFLKKRFNSIEK